jgi:hypothetical protein
VRISDHILLREHQGAGGDGLDLSFEKAPAQQREFLQRNSVFANEIQIGAHGNEAMAPVRGDRSERVGPDILVVTETCQHKFHELP